MGVAYLLHMRRLLGERDSSSEVMLLSGSVVLAAAS